MLTLIYSSGLRVSEITNIKTDDIIRNKMLLRIRQAKGNKDRYAILSEIALKALEKYWRAYHPTEWFFPGVHKTNQISIRACQHAFETAKKNALTAGVDRLIEFGVCDYSATPVPSSGGVVILNPEYGERMGEEDKLKETYKGIGDFFKKKCQGYTGYLFTGNLDLAKKVLLRTKKRLSFFNGPIECRLLEYDLY